MTRHILMRCFWPFLLSFLLWPPGAAFGARSALSDETQACLVCHAESGAVTTFQNGESVAVAVEPGPFRASVHGPLGCAGCHADFAGGKHPVRPFKSRLHYQTRASLACRTCHADDQIRKNPVHVAVLSGEKSGKPTLCANCHGAHDITRVSRKSVFASEEQYCLRCHNRGVAMRFRNGESRSLIVDVATIEASVHGKLSCSDCHFGFSPEEHPQRNFMTERDYILASSESCRRCHFDKYTKTLESIHYTMLSQGNTDAPVCVDCHGSHVISRAGRERAASAQRCQRCHAAVYNRYARSVHGSALLNDHNQDVPVCVDCHTAHTIEDPFSLDYRERIPDICSNCHANKEIMAKYGLSTEVVKTYLSDFHGVTLSLYKRQKGERERSARPIAVCTDCHGTHGISRTAGPGSVSVKANLLKRCQKCHPGAAENFPDAWLSHYEPSLKRTPLVYLAGLAYQAFIPVLIAGLALQILLHIWRYAVNR